MVLFKRAQQFLRVAQRGWPHHTHPATQFTPPCTNIGENDMRYPTRAWWSYSAEEGDRQTEKHTDRISRDSQHKRPQATFEDFNHKKKYLSNPKGPIYNSEGNSEALMLIPSVRLSAGAGQTARGRFKHLTAVKLWEMQSVIHEHKCKLKNDLNFLFIFLLRLG